MLASLPMYDWPEIRAATDAWWAGLAKAFSHAGIDDVPPSLNRSMSSDELWARPDMLLSQTCGYPLTHDWAGRLQVVATPCYRADGCEEANYCSFVLVPKSSRAENLEDLRGSVAAYNSATSQSGYAALMHLVAPFAKDGRFFARAELSGSHLQSMRRVAGGQADVCAVDALVWQLARRHRPELTAQLRSIARSALAPGLPYVSAAGCSVDRLAKLRAGLQLAITDPGLAEARAALLIIGFEELAPTSYRRILQLEQEAADMGYACLDSVPNR